MDPTLSESRLAMRLKLVLVVGLLASGTHLAATDGCATENLQARTFLDWQPLPDLPDELGVAGPFVGVLDDTLIVAGGANFPRPVWENDKLWHDRIHALTKTDTGYLWRDAGTLPRPIAYGAAVSTPSGVVCMGGNDAGDTFNDVFLLRWDAKTQSVVCIAYPPLPQPCAYGQAALVGNVIYLAGGQSGTGLESAMKNFWALDLSKSRESAEFTWQALAPWPGPSRAFNITVGQHNGYDDCVYVISGRRQSGMDVGQASTPSGTESHPAADFGDGDIQFLNDVWEFTPRTGQWRRRADVPRCVMAGTGIGFGQSHIFVLGGADGSLFSRADDLRDEAPGISPRGTDVSHDHEHLDVRGTDARQPGHDGACDVGRSHGHRQWRNQAARPLPVRVEHPAHRSPACTGWRQLLCAVRLSAGYGRDRCLLRQEKQKQRHGPLLPRRLNTFLGGRPVAASSRRCSVP